MRDTHYKSMIFDKSDVTRWQLIRNRVLVFNVGLRQTLEHLTG
jgi:hypothetical protein